MSLDNIPLDDIPIDDIPIDDITIDDNTMLSEEPDPNPALQKPGSSKVPVEMCSSNDQKKSAF